MSGTDEQRRRLERDARYDEKLAALLECLREGHEKPKPVSYGEVPIVGPVVGFGGIPFISAGGYRFSIFPCLRCGLVISEPFVPTPLGPVPSDDRADFTRIHDEAFPEAREFREALCACGHARSLHVGRFNGHNGVAPGPECNALGACPCRSFRDRPPRSCSVCDHGEDVHTEQGCMGAGTREEDGEVAMPRIVAACPCRALELF